MPGLLQPGEITLTAAIRRYLDVALFLLVFTGFGTVASTGRLDIPTVLLVSGALLFRGYILARRRQVLLTERWTNLLTIACVAFFIADEFSISKSFLDSLVHLVLFVMLVRLFSAQTDRDHFFLAGLSFAMVLAAAVLTVDSTFLFALAGFVLVATGTFILMEMMHACTRAAVQGRDPNVPRAYRKLSFAIATVAPVLLVLIFAAGALIFFVLPRVSTGYFNAYASGNDISTGFSDRVELGRIGQIQQSRSVVMHVRIDRDMSAGRELKLRGVILNKFDGHSWSNTTGKTIQLKRNPDGSFDLRGITPDERTPTAGYPVHYQVTLEPFVNSVFFLMANPQSLHGNYRQLAADSFADVYDFDPDRPVTRYEGDSVLRLGRTRVGRNHPGGYPPQVLMDFLGPTPVDPRVRALAQQITSSAPRPYEKAAALESYLSSHFAYTLELPRTTPQDPIANFLFERRQGHCEYFASAMAVMLRTLGIPSRVVNGFSGGEYNDVSSQYLIRASEAHSWVEAYIPDEGWVEFDPTPAGTGLTESHSNRFLLYLDAMASFWREWVVNYDLGRQIRLTQDASRGSRQLVGQAQSWFKSRYDRMLAWAHKTEDRVGRSTVFWGERVLALFVIALLIASFPRLISLARKLRLSRRPERAPQLAATLWYERMLHYAARQGFDKSPAQTPTEFASGIDDQRLRASVERFTRKYESARFGNSATEASKLPELYEEVKSSRSA
jgi:transglutaminase-like putative cysteine protease